MTTNGAPFTLRMPGGQPGPPGATTISRRGEREVVVNADSSRCFRHRITHRSDPVGTSRSSAPPAVSERSSGSGYFSPRASSAVLPMLPSRVAFLPAGDGDVDDRVPGIVDPDVQE